MNTTTVYTNQTSEKEEYETFQTEKKSAIIGLAVCFASVTLFTILSNSLVMSAIIKIIVKDFQLGLQNQPLKGGNSMITKFLILSMAFCGMVYTCFEMPLTMIKFAFHSKWPFGYVLCALCVYTDYLLDLVVNLHVAMLCIDTYIMICKPLHYRSLNARTGYIMLAISWSLPIVIIIAWSVLDQETIDGCSTKSQRFHSWDYSTIFPLVFGFLFLVLLLSIWIIYFQVLRMVLSFRKRLFYRRHSHLEITKQKLRIDASKSNSPAIVTRPANAQDRAVQNSTMSKSKFQNNVKCFRFVGLVLTSITAGRLPVWMLYILQYMTGLTISEWVNQFLGWLAFCTYSVNPILYCSNKTIFQAVKDIARKILKI